MNSLTTCTIWADEREEASQPHMLVDNIELEGCSMDKSDVNIYFPILAQKAQRFCFEVKGYLVFRNISYMCIFYLIFVVFNTREILSSNWHLHI